MPEVEAIPASNYDALTVYITPGEGATEEFETVLYDENNVEIARQTISESERGPKDDVIR